MDYRYHCKNLAECPDYDLCEKCYKIGHPHEMEQLGFGVADQKAAEEKNLSLQEQKRRSIQRCITALVHACECTNNACPEPSCIKMKGVVTHTKTCPIKAPRCNICKQLVALCCYHAKHCETQVGINYAMLALMHFWGRKGALCNIIQLLIDLTHLCPTLSAMPGTLLCGHQARDGTTAAAPAA